MSDPHDANDSNPHSNDPGRIYTFQLIPDCGPRGDGCALGRRVLTMQEAAAVCGVDRTTLTRHALSGALRTHLIGERRLVCESDLATFIDGGSGREAEVCALPPGLGQRFFSRGFCVKLQDQERYLCPLRLTVKEVAAAIRVHATSVAKFVSTGELASRKIKGARRISAFDLWRFFDNRVDGKDAFPEKEAC